MDARADSLLTSRGKPADRSKDRRLGLEPAGPELPAPFFDIDPDRLWRKRLSGLGKTHGRFPFKQF